jgi:biotin-dependent carboxylase-like uncharacterized protein
VTGPALVVRRSGPSTTVQDLGRPGLAHLGVPPSGAADAVSLRRANALVGNAAGAAALEATLAGPELLLPVGTVVAVTGGECVPRLDGRPVAWDEPVEAPAGSVLRVGPVRRGVRAYVAVRGGIAVPPVLGSRSGDLLSGLGPPPLRDGDLLPIGSETAAPGTAARTPLYDEPVLRLHRGPRADWLTPGALEALTRGTWSVRPDSNRVGIRLEGPALARAVPGELPSEGVVTGAVQVPPSGGIVVFLADHPVTGGYPVVGIVDGADLPLAAQARPGTRVALRRTGRW